MPHTTKSETVLKAFRRYIDSFNNCDLTEIKRQLNVDIEVQCNGAIASQGRDAIIPYYESDFKIGKRVEVTRGPILQEKGTTVDVVVTLVATTPGVNVVQLDVVYIYDIASMTQVRHIINNVKTLSSESV
ncbi:hypothetical protein ACFL1L_02350 [Thermoplasmatota archaeon]